MIEKTFSVDGPPDVEVRVESGRVEVRPGEPGTVSVTVDTKSPDFIVEQRGNSILVSSDRTTPWLSRGSAYVVIETPEGSDLRGATVSATIRIDVRLGKVDLKTASGDIELIEAEALTVKTASGNLDVATVEHALRFTSASGDLRIRDCCRGSVVISTASGNIYIERCDASINLNTASGDSRITNFTGRSASLKGMSGSATIGIPRRSEVSLDVNLLSGNLHLPDPEPRQGDPERQVSLQAKLVSGDLTIERV